MALNTKSHSKMLSFDAVHLFNLSVAFLTRNSFSDMPLVVEKDVLRNIVGFHPWRRGIGAIVIVNLSDLGVIGNDVFMTVKTFLCRWDPGIGGAPHIGMAELALNILYTGVDSVAEWYGLLRADVGGVKVKEIEEEHGSKCRQEGQEQGPPVPLQGGQESVV